MKKTIWVLQFLVGVVALVLVSLSSSAEEVSLDRFVDESLHDSLTVQKAKSAYEEATWKKRETYSGFLPTLSGGVSYLTDKKYMLLNTQIGGSNLVIPQVVPTTNYTLQASYSLFDGFASTNRLRAGQATERAAEKELDWTKFTVSRAATLQFYKSLASNTLRDVADQNLKAIRDHLKDVQALRKAGLSTNYDVLRTEVQVSEAESELLNAQDNVEMAKFKLGEVLGKDVEERAPSGALPVLKNEIINQLKEGDVSKRADLEALSEKANAAESTHQSLNRYWVPKLGIFGQYNSYNNMNDRFDDASAFRDAYQVGVNLTWNIFDGLVSTSRSAQSAQQALQIEKSVRQTQIKAKQDIEFWKRKYKYFCTIYNARQNDIVRSTEAVRLAKEGRRAGTRTSTEFLDAETDLFRARAGLVNAQIGAIEALINLELSSGQKLYDFK